jgi:transposase-like protein
MAEISYRRHRFPPVIIQHAVWLYLRFTLSYRDVEELLAERGLDISYETVRCWVLKFGPVIARRLRRCRQRPSNRWHLDEMVVRIAGERMYLWRAVDDEGEVLDMLVQRRRDTRAALRLMRKLLKKQGFAPKLLVTDKLRSYASAFRRLRPTCPHEQGLRKNIERKLASGGATTRAQNAALQVGSLRPAVSKHARRRPQHLTSNAIWSPARRCGYSAPRRRTMARCGRGRVSAHPASSLFCSPQVKLTVPATAVKAAYPRALRAGVRRPPGRNPRGAAGSPPTANWSF